MHLWFPGSDSATALGDLLEVLDGGSAPGSQPAKSMASSSPSWLSRVVEHSAAG